MKITLVLALLGVATFAATVLWLHLNTGRRRMVVIVHSPADWAARSVSRPQRRASPRNLQQVRSIPRLRVVA